jgi:hypothetical protein
MQRTRRGHPGLLVEFAEAGAMLAALAQLRDAGFERLETYTPWPVKGVDEALGLPKSPVPRAVLIAGLVGAATAYLIQWWTNAWDYPLDVGGRPAHAAPAFVLITFETTVLFAGLTALVAVLACSGLPRLWHPVFEVDAFKSASIDRFWIGLESGETALDVERVRGIVAPLGATLVVAVEGSGR